MAKVHIPDDLYEKLVLLADRAFMPTGTYVTVLLRRHAHETAQATPSAKPAPGSYIDPDGKEWVEGVDYVTSW